MYECLVVVMVMMVDVPQARCCPIIHASQYVVSNAVYRI